MNPLKLGGGGGAGAGKAALTPAQIVSKAGDLGVGIENLTIHEGVARLKIGQIFTVAGPDFDKVKLMLKEAGANKIVIDSGVVVDEKLANLLRKVAASGEPFQGGKVKLIREEPTSIPGLEGLMRPVFEIEVALP